MKNRKKLFPCIFIVKSTGKLRNGYDKNNQAIQHKEQMNQLSSFLDLTTVYGTSTSFNNKLRDPTDRSKLLMKNENVMGKFRNF